MAFRVTPHRQLEIGQSHAQSQYARGARIQLEITSGIRIHRPSDDPSGTKVVLNQTQIIDRIGMQVQSIEQARNSLNNAHTQILDAQQLLVRAKTIGLEARQTDDPTARTALVTELDAILLQLEDIANSKADGQFLFSGAQNTTQPFTGITSSNPQYQGSTRAGLVSLTGYPNIKVYYSGQEVFQPPASGSLSISGQTGILPGSGTASGNPQTTLTIQHTLTSYAAGSGVAASASSPGSDTILGPLGANQLVIRDTSGTGSFGTVSLNGGPEIAWTSGDSDLLVSGQLGESVSLDMTNITAGFDGTVDIAVEGTLSIDGGATQVAINYSANQTLTSSTSDAVQHFDTRNLIRTGTVQVEAESHADVFAAVRNLRNDILNNRDLSSEDWGQAIDRRIGDVEAAIDHTLSIIGQQSVTLEQLDNLQVRMEEIQLEAQRVLSETESTDVASAVLQMQEQQTQLQFTLATLATLAGTSILDFLA